MAKITSVYAQEILDSRGKPTLKVCVSAGNACGDFSVPSGASTGSHEAWEKRDGDKTRFAGLGVKKVAEKVNTEINKALKGKDAGNQKAIDNLLIELDGTPNKKRLGANAILGVSVACAKVSAKAKNLELHQYLKTLANIKSSHRVPYLYLNLINAGKHASSYLAFQEFMIVPMTQKVEEGLIWADMIKAQLKKTVVGKYGPFSANYGDEGGIVIQAKKVREAFQALTHSIKEAGLKGKVKLAIDAAADSFYEPKNKKYDIDGKKIKAGALMDLYKGIVRDFDMISIEDPFFEEEFKNFAQLLAFSKTKKTKIVGDDLTVTNPERLCTAIQNKSIDAIIIKPNQIGTLSETLDVMKSSRENNIECIISHRSGETGDDFIADLAYAFGAFGLKSGAPNRFERIAKYNRLWEISS
ncbi:MAG: enolase [bacterium]|nr:enolase [bacterium]